jgi:hypothetical protein
MISMIWAYSRIPPSAFHVNGRKIIHTYPQIVHIAQINVIYISFFLFLEPEFLYKRWAQHKKSIGGSFIVFKKVLPGFLTIL